MIFLIGIGAGLLLPIQTSINSKLRFKVGSPYLASTASMVTGMLFLMVIACLFGQELLPSLSVFDDDHWWLGLGGLMGAIAFTINVLLLPHLGAVQTIIMPLIGQIIMSMSIDNFGWFNLPVNHFNIVRLFGVLLLLSGVLAVIYQKSEDKIRKGNPIPWQLLGIIAGFALAIQTSSNGALGRTIHAPISAGVYSFTSGSIILVLAVGIFEHDFGHYLRAVGYGTRWWIWIGGPLGATYAFCNLSLAPIIGAGTTIVLTILGNVAGSVVIDKFGLIGTPKREIGWRQYLGLVIMICGVILIKLF
ncbi:DMT family transporter [Acetilactobacillus jinshanensis]|uniref:DMT family transporter n=1 Tax=Acetilactobacillus jinshanensis TaxID=1720083 RepID=A0A4P6ZK20_9LACO|nr:DMT family transporter [Acetilactobacillus jinshanensis]QBP18046.1 DMT family transporter [Acetilactobacillus jinshanensis]URL60909.1 DMT family transporter [uncultured bacterium]